MAVGWIMMVRRWLGGDKEGHVGKPQSGRVQAASQEVVNRSSGYGDKNLLKLDKGEL
jgi:hypothetical protein